MKMKINIRPLFSLGGNANVVPVFYACDDNYIKFMAVSLQSLILQASAENTYLVHILHTGISESNKDILRSMATDNVSIKFVDVSGKLAEISKKLAIRDYYSSTTYYRIFIPEMFPQFDKILYIDGDTIINRDVAKLYKYNLGDNYIGAIQDYLVTSVDVFGNYVEKVLGLSRAAYFNAGVVLINCEQFRKKKIEKKFYELLETYSFVVAQDQDYLNILCQDKILWIDSRWNVQMTEPAERPLKETGLIHYNLATKPWHSKDGRYSKIFWRYASVTPTYEALKEELENYDEEKRRKDAASGDNLFNLAVQEIDNEDNYFNKIAFKQPRTLTRQEIILKREQYEKEGRFDEDLEDDPPGRELMPNEITYIKTGISERVKRRYAFKIARWFVNTMIKRHQLIIEGYEGLENYAGLNTGAIITCNHFNAFDSFAMHLTYEKSGQRSRRFYRIIKEGNYTSFPGFFGYLMRNCDTLPLSSNKDTMKKFMKAVDRILQKGHFILIYPEQAMWWNYKKPRPLKKGAFVFAAKNNVPVLPIFITMSDSEYPGEGGMPVQKYTIHIEKPIYPDQRKKASENAMEMREKNFEVWKNVYERVYGVPLEYSCDAEKD